MGQGVFAFMPYSSLDLKNNGTFKIEFSENIDKFNEDMHEYYPNGYYITNCILGDDVNESVMQKIKEILPKKYRNDKDDIWIQCKQDFMNDLFRKICTQIDYTEYKEYGLTGRNDKDYKLYKVDQRENPIFGGLVVYHT